MEQTAIREGIAALKTHDESDRTLREFERQLGIPYVNLNAEKPYVPKQRIVHFDLKGAPPRVAFFKRVFPLIKGMGATGILLGLFACQIP